MLLQLPLLLLLLVHLLTGFAPSEGANPRSSPQHASYLQGRKQGETLEWCNTPCMVDANRQTSSPLGSHQGAHTQTFM
jgi:hypothetical protein